MCKRVIIEINHTQSESLARKSVFLCGYILPQCLTWNNIQGFFMQVMTGKKTRSLLRYMFGKYKVSFPTYKEWRERNWSKVSIMLLIDFRLVGHYIRTYDRLDTKRWYTFTNLVMRTKYASIWQRMTKCVVCWAIKHFVTYHVFSLNTLQHFNMKTKKAYETILSILKKWNL